MLSIWHCNFSDCHCGFPAFLSTLCWINLYIKKVTLILKGSLSVHLNCSLHKNSTSRICVFYFFQIPTIFQVQSMTCKILFWAFLNVLFLQAWVSLDLVTWGKRADIGRFFIESIQHLRSHSTAEFATFSWVKTSYTLQLLPIRAPDYMASRESGNHILTPFCSFLVCFFFLISAVNQFLWCVGGHSHRWPCPLSQQCESCDSTAIFIQSLI